MELFADASLGNIQYNLKTKSVVGSFICLSNKHLKISPLSWKSKIIDKVAEDIKSAETLALESSIDSAVFLSSMITELYTGQINGKHLQIKVNEDSKCLVESLYSTKKVKKKTMRVVISSIQQYLKKGIISDIYHMKSKDRLGDLCEGILPLPLL